MEQPPNRTSPVETPDGNGTIEPETEMSNAETYEQLTKPLQGDKPVDQSSEPENGNPYTIYRWS